MTGPDALSNADASLLRSNIRTLRDSAVRAHTRAIGRSKKLDVTVLILSTLTAGSLWFLCTSAGPPWLAVAAKWIGAIFATVCAVLTAYKEKITNYKKLADSAINHVRTLEELIGRSEDDQTRQSLLALHVEYRSVKAAVTELLVDLDLDHPHTPAIPMRVGYSGEEPIEPSSLLTSNPSFIASANQALFTADFHEKAQRLLKDRAALRENELLREAALRSVLDRLNETASKITHHEGRSRDDDQG